MRSHLVVEFISVLVLFAVVRLAEPIMPSITERIQAGDIQCFPFQSIPIILSPPLEKDGGFLRKATQPKTLSSRPVLLHRFKITWYTNEQGWPPGNDITASGQKTRYGVIACPIAFPFGARFIILMPWGDEEFICLDRFRDPTRWGLDIWLPSSEEGSKWHGEHWVLIIFDSHSLEEYGFYIEG